VPPRAPNLNTSQKLINIQKSSDPLTDLLSDTNVQTKKWMRNSDDSFLPSFLPNTEQTNDLYNYFDDGVVHAIDRYLIRCPTTVKNLLLPLKHGDACVVLCCVVLCTPFF